MVSLSDEKTLQPVWLGMFNILSSLFNIFEDRLSGIQQRGAAAVCNGRGRPLIMVDIAQVERLVELGVPFQQISASMEIYT